MTASTATPEAFVVSRNLHRRHLNESQRAMVAAKIATLARGANQHSPIGETISQGNAAELLNVGKRSVERAAAIHKHGTAAEIAAVERGEGVWRVDSFSPFASRTGAQLCLHFGRLKFGRFSIRHGRRALPGDSPPRFSALGA